MSDIILFQSFFRSLLIALAAVISGSFFYGLIHRKAYRPVWLLTPLFLCFFIPSVAVAYGYSTLSYRLVQNPLSLQALYVLIMTCRLAGPVTVFLIFIPSGISNESLHCYKLSQNFTNGFFQNFIKPLIFKLKSTYWRYLLAFVMAYMLAFSEFEIASLMNISHWSVFLFDSYSQGISGLEAFKIHALPFLLQGVLLLLFLTIIPFLGNHERFRNNSGIENSSGFYLLPEKSFFMMRLKSLLFFVLISFFIFIGVVYPLFVIIKSAIPGFSMLFQQFWMYKELISSLLFAVSASIAGYILALLFSIIFKRNVQLLLIIAFAPFLIGILPISMIVLEVFRSSTFSFLYDTPIPLLTALTLYCIPFVLLLHLIFNAFSSDETLHSSRLLLPFSRKKAMELLWQFKFRGTFWIFFFIFSLTYFDLTASAILSPVSMTTITARFYNLMHYGESEKLSATVCLSIIVPLLIFIIIFLVLRTLLKKWNAFSRI